MVISDPRLKILTLFYISSLSIMLENTHILIITAILGIIIWITPTLSNATKTNFDTTATNNNISIILWLVFISSWGTSLGQSILYQGYPKTIIFTIIPEIDLPYFGIFSGVHIFKEGLIHGFFQSFRLIANAIFATLLISSTSSNNILKSFQYFKLPYALSFMAMISLKFFPVILEEFKMVMIARKLRGYKFLKNGLINSIKIEVSTLTPIFYRSLKRAHEISCTLELRGFNPLNHNKVSFEKISLKDKVITALLTIAILAIIISKTLFILYIYNIFYKPELRDLYHFARFFL